MTAGADQATTEHGNREIALGNEILRTTVGSGLLGVAVEGTDDNDEMGVFIEPKEHIYGLMPGVDHYISRTKPEGVRSGPGDTDLVLYSLRKYLRLALKGNPTVLLPLYAPEDQLLLTTNVGRGLRELRAGVVSQKAVWRFLGYMHAQRERMMGGGKQNKVPNRPELIERYGWDTKYGSHALRLAYQGYEMVTTGQLELPLTEPALSRVLAVKTGKVPRAEVSAEINHLQQEVRNILDLSLSPLPKEPNLAAVSAWSVAAHESWWATHVNIAPGRKGSRSDS